MSMGLDFLELEDLSLTIPGIERERVRMPKAMLLGLIVEGLQQRMIGIAFSLLRNYGVLGSATKILNAATSVSLHQTTLYCTSPSLPLFLLSLR